MALAALSLSGSIPEGGICLFPRKASLALGQIRPLTNAILEHGCSTCGSVPIHFVDKGSNDPSDGILTVNDVKNPFCDGDCISVTGSPGASSGISTFTSGPTGTIMTTSEPAGIFSELFCHGFRTDNPLAASSTVIPIDSTTSAESIEASVTTTLFVEPTGATGSTTKLSGATVTGTAAPSSNVAGKFKAWKGIIFISMLATNAFFLFVKLYGV